MKPLHTIFLFVTLLLLSCSGSSVGRPVRRAERVVAEADSLWRAGQAYGDSAQLAEAYRTLHAWRFFCPDEYAHSCYHYGRLLRSKDDPVAAMQCFINATHTRTRDYHILGRVYSNMGTLCHMASDFELSYDMYEKSANCFLSDHDTLSYNFVLNDMAYELAEQGDKDGCYAIIKKIANICPTDSALSAYCYLSQAQACFRCARYDSMIHYAHLSKHYLPDLLSSTLQLAQAYSLLGVKDSAIYYANIVYANSYSLFERNNALYILTNDDDTKDIGAIRQTAADRSDTQKLLEIRQGKLSQAVQLLEQDLHRMPDYRWLIAIITTILLISLIIWIYRTHQKKKHALLSQQLEDLANAYSDMQSEKVKRIEQTCKMLRQSDHLQTDLQWQDYDLLCDVVNKNFYMMASKLKATHLLNEREIRMCILVLIGGFTGKQLARWLYYAESGIRNLKNHTAHKLGTNSTKLREFLLKLAIDGYVKE